MLIGGHPLVVPRAFAEEATESTTSTEPAQSTKPVYSYDETTNHWNSDKWHYNGETGTYEPVTPAPTTTTPTPTTTEQAPATDATQTQPSTVQQAPTSSSPTSNESTHDGSTSQQAQTNTNSTINNGLDSNAISGDAGVTSNTNAGNATTGDASATTTIANVVNSAVTPNSVGDVANFVSNISGDVHGDIVLYPMILAAILQAASSQSHDTTLTSNNSTDITNDINLNAMSGDATVANNTQAGSATTGAAHTVANVINIINSVIASGTSFIGTVNIYGNLDGDILISPDFLPQLLSSTASSNTDVTSTNNQAITNNLNLNATTGNATIAGNTEAGNATTGNAATNVVLLNLTGHQVVASDSLLVFVNVLGTWVGMIIDTAPGSTSAALGNGVSQNLIGDTAINSTNDATITNNLNLNSQSGDATVTHNTQAGSATSGNATASANILNMAQSTFGLSGWFGILFINVFGSWNGSFGIDTSSGNPITQPTAASESSSGTDTSTPAVPEVIQFIARPSQPSLTAPFFGDAAPSVNSSDDVPVIQEPDREDSFVWTEATTPIVTTIPATNEGPLPMFLVLSVLLLAAGAFRGLFRIV
jgi:hypothetical protein